MYILVLALAISTFDAKMSNDEMQTTGISRLNIQERRALENWIEDHYEKKTSLQGKKKEPQIQENLKCGHYIRLTDDSLWRINPKDTLITQSWITQVAIVVQTTDDELYPFFLTNSLTGSSVKAEKVTLIN